MIASIASLDESLRHVAHIDDRHNIVAGADDKTLAGIDQRDEAPKAGVVARAIDPCRARYHDGRAALFYQIGDEFFAGDLGAAIGIVFGAKRVILGHDTMQVMPVNGDRAGMHDALHARVHRGGNQIGHAPDIDGGVFFFQTPGACPGRHVIDNLHVLYGAFQRLRVGQIAMRNFNARQRFQVSRVFGGPHHRAHFVAAFQQHINKMAAQETGSPGN